MSEPKQPIFIFGAPRTGTTLLQRLLNSYDDVLIWGEHRSFLRSLSDSFQAAWSNPDLFNNTQRLPDVLKGIKPETWQAWLNWFGEEDWRMLHRKFLESVFVPSGLPGKKFWGWKDVHYFYGYDDRIVIDYLHKLFPEALFVFIIRNAFNSIASYSSNARLSRLRPWYWQGCENWAYAYRAFRNHHASKDLESFWIRYEDLIRGEGEILRLLKRLGKDWGEPQRRILSMSQGRGTAFDDENYNERWKNLSPIKTAIMFAAVGELNQSFGYPLPRLPFGHRIAGRLARQALRLGRRWALIRKGFKTPLR